MTRRYHARPRPLFGRAAPLALALATGAPLAACGTADQAARLVLAGDSRALRERPGGRPERSPDHAPLLVVALDGVERALLYDLLRDGALPGFARLLGAGPASPGVAPAFPSAHFDETILATLPSSTMVAWTTTFTGSTPAWHGVTGNEFFIREQERFAAPVPVTFSDASPTLACFTSDAYCSGLIEAPTVYERMRERDPDVLVWVAMQHVHRGADVLLLAERTALANAFEGALKNVVKSVTEGEEGRAVYEELDRQVVRVVVDEVDHDDGALPDVLTVYLSGTDLYGHVAAEGPDASRSAYLREVLDPEIGRLADHLRARGALDDRWVVITSDHGHTEVEEDDRHALSVDGAGDPPAVLEQAGFRVRPFALEVDPDDDFQAVLAYQGTMAFVYVADRSTCTGEGEPCDWRAPPRYEEDVLAAAEAFHAASTDGAGVPAMKGTLDMVLARRPRPYAEVDAPFEVYVGGGRLVPVPTWLAQNPRPTYRALEERLRDLAVGPRGERAGDVLLIARNGAEQAPQRRFYFAAPYRSWHGSPSARDSEIPLVVAHPALDAGAIGRRVARVLGPVPRQQKIADLLLDLRYGDPL
jgi:hypothetical protein